MRLGIMTGGGDAPGLNGIIESTSRALLRSGHEIIGICDGFEGVFENQTKSINLSNISGLHSLAGTLLGTSNRCGTKGREQEFVQKYRRLNLDGLIIAGGDGTFMGVEPFKDEIPIIGVPKTIDNDLSGTEITFGYDTACSVVADSVDALRATADAHRRCMVVEAMGRTAGWIALGGGLSAYADVILVPERPFSKPDLVKFIISKKDKQRGLMCVVAEGASAIDESAQVAFKVEGSPQEERYGGIGEHLARFIENEAEWESRHVVLGFRTLAKKSSPHNHRSFSNLSNGL
jgi:ATP-dependent phosphofructokinase / diphosphate-dependent phosphofructokinase